MLGDLNATPSAPEIRTLVEDLVDVWEVADVVARSVAVVSAGASVTASDHLPVVAEVALPGDKVGVGR